MLISSFIWLRFLRLSDIIVHFRGLNVLRARPENTARENGLLD
jgi:hypothetical protein